METSIDNVAENDEPNERIELSVERTEGEPSKEFGNKF